MKEVKQLIDDLEYDDFLQATLGFGQSARLNLNKLVLGGHSFGGMTAIEVAAHDQRVKALFSFDPWLWPR